MSFIVLENIKLSFGGVQVLHDVNLAVEEGELHALVGPNGSGKTSLLNCINRFYKPYSGRIVFNGEDITHLPSHKVAERGIGRAFQNIELFGSSTVLENIKLGRHIHYKSGILSNLIYLGKTCREEATGRDEIEREIIELLELETVRKEIVGALPFGLQKRVELARALAIKPKLLLLDEPTGGMNREERENIVRYILDVHDLWKVTIIMVEHDMGVVMDISNRITVLNFGMKIAEGAAKEIQSNPEVIKAYLGTSSFGEGSEV
jgi:branched-chain amino acid transport system ATP-binding protein